MAGASLEGEESTHICQAAGTLYHIAYTRVPGIAGIQIVEVAVPGQEHLAPAGFLCRTAIVPDGTAQAVLFHVVLGGNSGCHSAGAQSIVSAAVTGTALDDFLVLPAAGFLAQAGKGIKLTQDTDDRLTAAPGSDKRCGNAIHAFLYLKALFLQSLDENGSGFGFVEVQLRHGPYFIADSGELFTLRLNQFPDLTDLFFHIHCRSSLLISVRSIFCSLRLDAVKFHLSPLFPP